MDVCIRVFAAHAPRALGFHVEALALHVPRFVIVNTLENWRSFAVILDIGATA